MIAPALTIVIAASHSVEAVNRTLASLGPPRPDVEVIVAAAWDCLSPGLVADEGIIFLPAPIGSGVPRLRRLGLDRALGKAVAFTEDSCIAPDGWAAAWLVAFSDPFLQAATGPVVPAMGERAIDWAVFFCEYAPFVLGRTTTISARLAGNNFAVRRELRTRLDPIEVHEGDVPALLSRPSGCPRRLPSAAIGHARRYRLAEALGDRLRFGRDYGRRRASALPRTARLPGLLIGPIVLFVQVVRLVITVCRQGRNLVPFVETLPVTLVLLTAWSVGEWLGWAGAALTRDRRASASPRRRERAVRTRARTAFRLSSGRTHYKADRTPA